MKLRIGCALLLCAACVAHAASSGNAQELLADAEREYNAGRYDRAVDMLTNGVAKFPGEAPLHFLLGKCYYHLREFPRASASLERSVQLVPDQSEYHDWLGKAYGRRAEESILFSAMSWARKTHKEFETAVQLNPSNLEAQRDLIRFEMYAPGIVSGGDDKALHHIEALEKIDPVDGRLAHGEFLNAKKRNAEADAVFAQILESDTDRIGVYFEVADYYRDRKNYEKMGEAITTAQRIDSADLRLKYYEGVLLVLQRKDLPTAETLLRSYLATVPNRSDLPSHATARDWLGKLYEAESKFAEAAGEYRLSLALDPHDKEVQEDLKRVERK
jgi:tetratricopeptide (TPR) repeat protein